MRNFINHMAKGVLMTSVAALITLGAVTPGEARGGVGHGGGGASAFLGGAGYTGGGGGFRGGAPSFNASAFAVNRPASGLLGGSGSSGARVSSGLRPDPIGGNGLRGLNPMFGGSGSFLAECNLPIDKPAYCPSN